MRIEDEPTRCDHSNMIVTLDTTRIRTPRSGPARVTGHLELHTLGHLEDPQCVGPPWRERSDQNGGPADANGDSCSINIRDVLVTHPSSAHDIATPRLPYRSKHLSFRNSTLQDPQKSAPPRRKCKSLYLCLLQHFTMLTARTLRRCEAMVACPGSASPGQPLGVGPLCRTTGHQGTEAAV